MCSVHNLCVNYVVEGSLDLTNELNILSNSRECRNFILWGILGTLNFYNAFESND